MTSHQEEGEVLDYKQLKEEAYRRHIPIREVLALAPQNDPHYSGTPGGVVKAKWFAGLWRKFGYSSGIHLRRMHYAAISQQPPVLKPNGSPYGNTERDWAFLNAASKSARYLGTVDPRAFVDRRNPEPKRHASYWEDPTPDLIVTDPLEAALEPEVPDFPEIADIDIGGYSGNLQPYHQELWAEKTTMNDVLEPICRSYGVNLVTGAGEMSITSVLQFLSRVNDAGRPAHILYLADFDPAGYGMPVSVARKIEFFHDEGFEYEITLEPLALTREQVERWELPRTPIKATESRRGKFEDIHGEGAVELDAIEALYPGRLAEIVKKALDDRYDHSLADRMNKQRRKLDEHLEGVRNGFIEDSLEELEALQTTYAAATKVYKETLADTWTAAREISHTLAEQLAGCVDSDILDNYPLPEPELPGALGEVAEDSLYASWRDYWGQLSYYKARKAGDA